MKYKLLKQIEEKDSIKVWSIFDIWDHRTTLDIDIPECQVPINFLISQWYIEEVKEAKTIYDLKKWDKYYVLDDWNEITKYEVPSNAYFDNPYCRFNCFVTEREAKRNKLLRELDTRTDKWLPEQWDKYYSYHLDWCDSWSWQWDNTDIIKYHMWLVFCNEEEYDKWMTEEAKDLLFKL